MIAPKTTPSIRVAIYTRKSTSEGLEQEFNTLEAQRQAVEAYVESQRGEGWVVLPEQYSDGGFSGATTDRPGFQRLMDDVRSGNIDVVGVYKIDRLSRSLTDFARIMELFDECGTTFVSVTQQFSTTSSMGKLTLNILMSFAEFERETIAERTRDKMAASRKRGLWTGGRPVLGYDVEDKRLVVNGTEAAQVRDIFQLYLARRSILGVAEELRQRGVKTKTLTTQAGKTIPGRPFDKHAVRRLLGNVIYAGRVEYEGELYDGAHDAIIDQETWDAVQTALKENGSGARQRSPSPKTLLSGLVRCAVCGSAMGSVSSRKGSRQYRYYVCAKSQKEGAKACPGSRVSVGELERFVIDRIRDIGRDPAVLRETLRAARERDEPREHQLREELETLNGVADRLATERTNLLDAVGQGGRQATSIVTQLGQLDLDVEANNARRLVLQRDLDALAIDVVDEDGLRRALASFDPVWDELFPAEQARILNLLLERVSYDAGEGEVELTFRSSGIRVLARESQRESA